MVRKTTKKMVRKTTKNNKDFIFKVILSALLTANVAINGIMAYNTAKIAKNTQTPSQIKHTISQIDVKPVLDSNEILYEASPIISESDVNTNETMDGIYIIQKGDRLSELVNNWYGKYDYKLLMAFAEYNNIKNVDKIYTGDFLYIPTEAKLNEIIAQNNGFVIKTQRKPSVVAKSNKVVSSEDKVVSKTTENKVVSNEARVVSNETTKDITSLQSDMAETKQMVAVNNAKIDTLEKEVAETKNDIISLDKKVEENTKSISTLDTQVKENTKSIETLDTKVNENTESIESLKKEVDLHQKLFDFYEGEIRPDSEEINSIKSEVNKNTDNIDAVDKKLDTYINIEASEMNIIVERLDSLEKSWVNGSLSIDEVLQRMSNMEQAIQNLSNNTISKEEAMSIIDNSGKVSEPVNSDEIVEENKHYEKINEEDINVLSDEAEEPKSELISEDEIQILSDEVKVPNTELVSEEDLKIPSDEIEEPKAERIPEEEIKLPSDKVQEPKTELISEEELRLPDYEIKTPKAELIPEEEARIPSADSIIFNVDTLPKQEKITDIDLPYIENESEKEEVKQPQDDEDKIIHPFDEYQEPEEEFFPEEKIIFPSMEQKFVKNISESIIAYAKTR